MSGTSSRELDFDGAVAGASAPPLEFADGSFELIEAHSALTKIDEGWADWLLELRRLLAKQGVLVIGLAAPEDFERLTGDAWNESEVGMTVLSALDGPG